MTFAFVMLVLLLFGCARPTPYQPATDGYGYAEQQIEENRWRVSFSGNTATPRESVQNYLLFRAAEVTLATGHDYFTTVDQDLERDTTYYGHVSPSLGFGFAHPHHHLGHFGYSSVTAQPVDRYRAFADIVVFEGEKPPGNVNAYDARDVIKRLRPTVQLNPQP